MVHEPAGATMRKTYPVQIAVDAVGGDHGLEVVLPGAIAGARQAGVGLLLTGPEAELQSALAGADAAGVTIEIVDAPETIGMDEHPAQAVRRKSRSSIAVALEAVRDGRAGSMVSAGNSGAVMAAALLILGRVPGVDRPALASFFPALKSRTLVLDLGAVTDPKPHHLVQFAQMGTIYLEQMTGVSSPTVGLLSNGEEPSKGNQLVRDAFPLLTAAPGIDFRGNVEGKDVTRGVVDIIVTDGFTGNVALKVAEGVATLVSETVRTEVTSTMARRLAALTLRPAFRGVKAKLDYSETGGAALLGVNGMVVVAHGRSDERAIMNAIGVASRGAESDIAATIRRLLVPAVSFPATDGDRPPGAEATAEPAALLHDTPTSPERS